MITPSKPILVTPDYMRGETVFQVLANNSFIVDLSFQPNLFAGKALPAGYLLSRFS